MSFAYFNQGGKEADRRRRWARDRFNELVGKEQRCAAQGCAQRRLHGIKFCQDCLNHLPTELRDAYLELQKQKDGGPEWQEVFASCLNDLAMRPTGGLS